MITPTLNDLLKLIADSDVRVYYFKDVINILLSSTNLTMQKLIQKSRLPRSLIIKILKQLQIFLHSPSEFIQVKEEYRAIFQQYLDRIQPSYVQKYDWIKLGTNTEELTSFLKEILIKRPPPKRSLDQFDATIDTLLRRVSFLEMEGALSESKILFLGDHDLTSLAIAKRGGPKEIHILDIDNEILTLIREVADKYSFPITTHTQDLRLGFPNDLQSSFNIVFTDPPFTINGAKLFLSNAIKAIIPGGFIYTCFGYSPNNFMIGNLFQKLLNELGLIARTILENFNVYSKAQAIGSTSHLFKLVSTKDINKIHIQINGQIYSGYKEEENLLTLISPSFRYKIINKTLINRLVRELLMGSPKAVGFINSTFGMIQNQLIEKGILVKDIELDIIEKDIAHLIAESDLEIIYPPPEKSKIIYEKLVIESPCFDLDSIIDWMHPKICKNIYIIIPDQIQNITPESKTVKISQITKILLSIFWKWNLISTIPLEAFEPSFYQPTYLYRCTPLIKELLLQDPNKYILRELFEQPTKKVINALREGIIRFYQQMGKQFTKKQSIKLVKELGISNIILHLQVQQLSNSEINHIIKAISAKNFQILK